MERLIQTGIFILISPEKLMLLLLTGIISMRLFQCEFQQMFLGDVKKKIFVEEGILCNTMLVCTNLYVIMFML